MVAKRTGCAIILALLAVGCGQPATEEPGPWSGSWHCEQWGELVLSQTGTAVAGSYEHDSGKIEASASGNTLVGRWSEAPSYTPPSDAGDVELTMSADGRSFTGRWRYGNSGDWDGSWNGRRTGATP